MEMLEGINDKKAIDKGRGKKCPHFAYLVLRNGGKGNGQD